MLTLIFANGHHRGVIEQDVGSLQDGVSEEANGRVVGALFLGFVLELGHPAGLTKAGEGVQNPGQFAVGGDVGLDKQC
ncbi:unannotated protein [freshwater metagenome]|uniref:Unannotated protein n=1 Tax=freshwater metagenome TaxID=449393 RepID=A0A6J6JU70_9ZZZZ